MALYCSRSRSGSCHMPTYVMLSTWTDQGIRQRGFAGSPGWVRYNALPRRRRVPLVLAGEPSAGVPAARDRSVSDTACQMTPQFPDVSGKTGTTARWRWRPGSTVRRPRRPSSALCAQAHCRGTRKHHRHGRQLLSARIAPAKSRLRSILVAAMRAPQGERTLKHPSAHPP
jgi:hypothetical protein